MLSDKTEYGGVYLQLEDLDTVFSMMTTEPLIVNDFDITTEEARKYLNNLMMSQYEGDSLSVVASCACGTTTGGFYVGSNCKVCHQPVFSITEQPLKSYLWIRTPTGIKSLMNPNAWAIIHNALFKQSVSLLDWATTASYRVSNEDEKLKKLKAFLANYRFADGQPFKRSWNFFVEHFDEVIDILFTYGIRGGKAEKEIFFKWLSISRDLIFCNFLPVPSRLTFITESTSTGVYAESTMRPALAALRTISELEFSVVKLSETVLENRTVGVISSLANFYNALFKDTIGPKPGVARQHIFGSRVNFTFRAVISSITDAHDGNHCYLPWRVAVPLLWIHLSKKLMDRGMTVNEINCFLSERVSRYDPLLDELFKEIINDCPEGGLTILLCRNPSLVKGSMQRFVVPRIKTDVSDTTIQISALCLAGFNADFDGSFHCHR